jgi:1-acyl-sn-glycerol-3-phosphate acyltransferase
MKMPELVPDNYVDIYKFFEDFEPNRRVQNFGFAIMNAVCDMQVQYAPGSDSTIHDHLSNSGSVLLSANHQSAADIPVIANIVNEDPFEGMRSTTIIPAKAEMFGWPVIGRLFPHMSAHPAFRSKDFKRDKEGMALGRNVTEEMIRLNVDHINNGGNCAIFPEATRNRNNPREILSLGAGLGRIATGIECPSKLLVVPLGIAYKPTRLRFHPVVVVGDPFSPEDMTKSEVRRETSLRMQASVTNAFEFVS